MQFPKITLPAWLHWWKKTTDTDPAKAGAPTPAPAFGHRAGEKKVPERQKKLMDLNPWWVVAVLTFLFFLWTIGYYSYLSFYKIGQLEETIKQKEAILMQKKQEVMAKKKDPSYMRYKATEKLTELDKTINRRESIIYLIGLYDIMKALGSNESRLLFSDFQISSDRILVRGIVPTMAEIYKEQWLIDRLMKFDFIEHITIPYYKEQKEMFNFVLDAKIKQYDGTKPAS
jgi:hypothetical protein